MGCLCEQLTGKEVALSPVCIGNLWIFENLQPEELSALTENAFRKAYQAGENILSREEVTHGKKSF